MASLVSGLNQNGRRVGLHSTGTLHISECLFSEEGLVWQVALPSSSLPPFPKSVPRRFLPFHLDQGLNWLVRLCGVYLPSHWHDIGCSKDECNLRKHLTLHIKYEMKFPPSHSFPLDSAAAVATSSWHFIVYCNQRENELPEQGEGGNGNAWSQTDRHRDGGNFRDGADGMVDYESDDVSLSILIHIGVQLLTQTVGYH